jgi:transcriptional regulator with XRE-family HTH domain
VKELRKARNWTQEQMANALGVTPSAYEKYEARTPMPSYLIPRFAQLVGFTIAYVMTGEQEAGPSATMPGRRRGRHGKQINQTNRRLDC